MYAYEYIYKKLLQKNVKDVFMYSGGAIMSLIDQFHVSKNNNRISAFVNSNENHSVSTAVGYSKVLNYLEPKKKHTGVVITTSGPGLTNCVSGILDAQSDSTPLVVISGQVPLKVMGSNAFQEAPSTDITKSITKKNFLVKNANELPQVLEDAFFIANNKKKGAVHIDIPKCVLNSKITNFDYQKTTMAVNENIYYNLIQEVAHAINKAERPVLYVGKGASDCGSIIYRMAHKTKMFVSTTIHALGTFNENSNLSLKMMGMHGTIQANMALQNADLILCLGGRFDDRCVGKVDEYASCARKNKALYFCNIEESEFGKMIADTKNIQMDCFEFCKKLEPLLEEKSLNHEFYNMILLWKHSFVFNRQKFFMYLNRVIEVKCPRTEINFVCGVGNHQMYTAQYINFNKYKRLFSSGSLGNMESGLPNAIGVKIARPDSMVLCIIGDGSFHMSCNDLLTISTYVIDIKIFVIDNQSQDMVRCWEDIFYEGRITATKINKINYQDLASAYNLEYVKIDTIENNEFQIQNSIYSTLLKKKATLCHVIAPQDYCFPLVKPGHALHEMLTNYSPINSGSTHAPS